MEYGMNIRRSAGYDGSHVATDLLDLLPYNGARVRVVAPTTWLGSGDAIFGEIVAAYAAVGKKPTFLVTPKCAIPGGDPFQHTMDQLAGTLAGLKVLGANAELDGVNEWDHGFNLVGMSGSAILDLYDPLYQFTLDCVRLGAQVGVPVYKPSFAYGGDVEKIPMEIFSQKPGCRNGSLHYYGDPGSPVQNAWWEGMRRRHARVFPPSYAIVSEHGLGIGSGYAAGDIGAVWRAQTRFLKQCGYRKLVGFELAAVLTQTAYGLRNVDGTARAAYAEAKAAYAA